MSLPEEDDKFNEFTVLLESGHVAFDFGFVTRIEYMWDQDGEPTLDFKEAVHVAFAYPSDLSDRRHVVLDLSDLGTDEVEPFH